MVGSLDFGRCANNGELELATAIAFNLAECGGSGSGGGGGGGGAGDDNDDDDDDDGPPIDWG